MKTETALSWKGIACSAALHGAVFAAAGWVLLKPAQVGTQEAPVTAEFQILSEHSAASSDAMISEAPNSMPISSQETPPEKDDADFSTEVMTECEPDAVRQDPVVHDVPVTSARRPSVPRVPSVATRGATNIQPDYLNNPPPCYPESSRLAGEQGVVMVRAEVAASGRVEGVTLGHSSGYRSLDRAALDAVAAWKFRPASAAGIAMGSEVTVPVRFELHQARAGQIRGP